jgi:diketogulonate reductase-like aldo/keto reductase
MEKLLLRDGMSLPKLGLGTFGIKDENMPRAIAAAKDAGIRLFDTSPNYEVDASLGRALKQMGLRREEITIVQKVDTGEQLRPIRIALEKCLARMGTDYIDLYLIHWPFPGRYVDTWRQMNQLCREGLVRSIGVCNFMQHHLSRLIKETDTVPVVNQIELHPLFSQPDTVEYCRRRNIAVMAYTPLGRMNPALINHPLLDSLSRKYGRTVPQIILRWDIQSGFVTIPKSQSPARIRKNSEIFDFCLSDEDMVAINALNCGMRLRFDPDDLSRYPLSPHYRLWLRIRAWTWARKKLLGRDLGADI